jgi:hypothetical protein
MSYFHLTRVIAAPMDPKYGCKTKQLHHHHTLHEVILLCLELGVVMVPPDANDQIHSQPY